MNVHTRRNAIMLCIFILSIGSNALLGISYYKGRNNKSTEEAVTEVYTRFDFENYAQEYLQKKLSTIFTPEEIKYIASKQYRYYLSVNNQMINSNVIRLSNATNVRIVLSEIADEAVSLPADLQKTGSLTYGGTDTELTDFLSVYAKNEVKITKKIEGANTIYYLDLEKVPKNSIISMTIGDVLLGNLSQAQNIKGNHIDICIQ